jgi:hypothetical protein
VHSSLQVAKCCTAQHLTPFPPSSCGCGTYLANAVGPHNRKPGLQVQTKVEVTEENRRVRGVLEGHVVEACEQGADVACHV